MEGHAPSIPKPRHFQKEFLRTVLLKIDPAGKLLKLFNDLGFTMHNDSGHLPYQR